MSNKKDQRQETGFIYIFHNNIPILTVLPSSWHNDITLDSYSEGAWFKSKLENQLSWGFSWFFLTPQANSWTVP
jgi:hypothetical protein